MINTRFMDKVKSFGMRCHPSGDGLAIVDETLPVKCDQNTGITIPQDQIPQSDDYDLLHRFPQIARYLKKGRKKNLDAHLLSLKQTREFIRSIFV